MVETKKQLKDRLKILESLLADSALSELRTRWRKECLKSDELKAQLVAEIKLKQHWEDCAERLMIENEQLRCGVSPDALEKYWKKKAEELQAKLDKHPFGAIPDKDFDRISLAEKQRDNPPEKLSWWKRLKF